MNYHSTHEEVQAIRADREHVAGLLQRYPAISDQEKRDLVFYFKTARHLDIGLLTSNEALRPQLDRFMDDHTSHFRLKLTEGVAVICVMIALVTLAWLAWEAFQ